MKQRQKTTPSLAYDEQAEAAAKFSASWQIVPSALARLLGGSDAARAQRVMTAMLKIVKFDIAALENA